jgi:hypothetical protein
MLNRKDGKLYRTKHHFVGGLILAVIVAACAVGYLIDSEKAEVRIGATIFFVVCGANSLRLAFAGIHATNEGIHVANIVSSYRLRWSEVHKFRIGPWSIFPYICLIDLKNGRTKHAFGIQERTNFPDGSAERMAEELNAELVQRTGESLQLPSKEPKLDAAVGVASSHPSS